MEAERRFSGKTLKLGCHVQGLIGTFSKVPIETRQ
jgi:hypothetical protein